MSTEQPDKFDIFFNKLLQGLVLAFGMTILISSLLSLILEKPMDTYMWLYFFTIPAGLYMSWTNK